MADAFALGLLLAGGFIGTLVSSDPALSLQKLASMAVAAGVFTWMRRLDLQRLATMLITAGVIVALAGDVLVDRASIKLNPLNEPIYALFAHVPRFSELAMSQNGLAAFLILVIPFAVVRRQWLVAGVLATELLLTDSRAAVLSLGLALGLLGWCMSRWWTLAPAVSLAAIIGGALGAPSTGERLAIWQSALYMLADHPVTGIGLGMFQRVYPEYMLPAYHNTHPHAHNLFLQTWLDSGMLGLAGMLLLVALAAVRIPRAAEPLTLGAAMSSAAVLLHAQVDSYFAGDPRTYWLMFLPLGIVAARVPAVLPKPARSLAAVPLVLLPASQAIRLPETEWTHFQRGQALFSAGRTDEAVREWRLAHAAPYLVRQGRFDLALLVDPQDEEAREGELWTPVRPRLPADVQGRAAELAGDYQRAEAFYRLLRDPIGLYRLGVLDLRTGRTEQALRELQAAARAIPNQEDFRLALARAYDQAGDSERAREEYQAVLKLNPGRATSPAGYRA